MRFLHLLLLVLVAFPFVVKSEEEEVDVDLESEWDGWSNLWLKNICQRESYDFSANTQTKTFFGCAGDVVFSEYRNDHICYEKCKPGYIAKAYKCIKDGKFKIRHELPWQCPTTHVEYNHLCWPACPAGYVVFGGRYCARPCPAAFPINCGSYRTGMIGDSVYCGKTAADCVDTNGHVAGCPAK
eukprot:TRINITY_DN1536_c0_g1_i2.p2 TRINITY_DN1536_c0_g1~~TRINITY_DN1536_c0_g1_i2.p2  ORF type:complete len:184 (+),score=56.98 TRINITY_DN1536_c0_g1_i2:54-605(+)